MYQGTFGLEYMQVSSYFGRGVRVDVSHNPLYFKLHLIRIIALKVLTLLQTKLALLPNRIFGFFTSTGVQETTGKCGI